MKRILTLAMLVALPALAQQPKYDLPAGVVEGSTAFVDITFRSEKGVTVTPSEITYFVTGESPAAGTQFLYGPIVCKPSPTPSIPSGACAGNIPAGGLNSTMTLRLPSAATKIVDDTKAVETHAVNLQWVVGSDYNVARATFPVKNSNIVVGGTPPGGPTPAGTPAP